MMGRFECIVSWMIPVAREREDISNVIACFDMPNNFFKRIFGFVGSFIAWQSSGGEFTHFLWFFLLLVLISVPVSSGALVTSLNNIVLWMPICRWWPYLVWVGLSGTVQQFLILASRAVRMWDEELEWAVPVGMWRIAIGLVDTFGWCKLIWKNNASNALDTFPLLGFYVFRERRVFAKSALRLREAWAVSMYLLVSAMEDPTGQYPAGKEEARHWMLSFPSNDDLARFMRMYVA